MENGHADTVQPKTWKTWERCITINKDKVIKRELHEEELIRHPNGNILQPFWAKERLQNEAATILFLLQNTTIPVPTCRLFIKDGVVQLEMERITTGVLLEEIDEVSRPAAVAAVDEQMEKSILPQLRSFRRNHIGSVDQSLPVFPPQRVYDRDRRAWEQITSETSCFVLCHNDLGPQNIFICPNTFQIVGIIDWEFAGYFPPYFELQLWRAFSWDEEQKMYDAANSRELEFFGLRPEDLKDTLLP